ncbi:3-phosphoshikimate 1-carboxyvinyltransferase [Anaerofustis stercorihominis]|uniref:3-phosphoshikimate 1-carboxyvinyltransferase n=1 Tax=Anaerofustis stercorihominis TaxID=214853 RepID=A0A3E3DW54_9FIRM|nr:hypothetical protein [Anaerofustis stercorihominis]RGD73502.1 hypothetical protein DW687_09085 [Anaerofustis stercorihominis]
MEITLDSRILNGKVTAKPVLEDLKRYLICSLFTNETSIINNVLLDKETKEILDILSLLGARITVDEFRGKRKTLRIKGSYPFDIKLEEIDLGNNLNLLRTFAPILLISKTKFNLKYKNTIIQNPLNSFYSLFFEKGFTKIQMEKGEYPLKIKTGIDKSVFYIRADVEKECLSTLLSMLPRAYRASKVIIIGEIKDKAYINRTIQILKDFEINVKNNNFKEFDIINTKYEPCNVTVENDFTMASIWITASALGHKVMVKDLNLKSRQNNKKLLDILKVIGIDIFASPKGDIIARPNRINAFNIDISKVPDLMPYLAVIASVADGTSKLKNVEDIYIKDTLAANDLSHAINSVGGDSFIFGGDLIIRGREMLKGGTVNDLKLHESIFALCAVSRQALSPIKAKVPSTMPNYYKEFYRDFTRLGGKRLH